MIQGSERVNGCGRREEGVDDDNAASEREGTARAGKREVRWLWEGREMIQIILFI